MYLLAGNSVFVKEDIQMRIQEFRKSAGVGPLNPSNGPPRGLWEQEAVKKVGKHSFAVPVFEVKVHEGRAGEKTSSWPSSGGLAENKKQDRPALRGNPGSAPGHGNIHLPQYTVDTLRSYQIFWV